MQFRIWTCKTGNARNHSSYVKNDYFARYIEKNYYLCNWTIRKIKSMKKKKYTYDFIVKTTLFVAMIFATSYVTAKNFNKSIKKVENNIVFNISINVNLDVDDTELETALAKEMFHHDGDIKGASEEYLKQYANAKREDAAKRTIHITARLVDKRDSTGLVCVAYTSAGKEHIADVSKEKHLTYDRKNRKVVKLSDLISPALYDYMKKEGVDAANVTDLKTVLYTYSAKSDVKNIDITPYKLYKHMTDYGLELIGMNRAQIEREIAEGIDLSKVYETAEIMPSFPGGKDALMRFLKTNLTYPPEAEENGIQGIVAVSFIVASDGSIHDIAILKSVNPLLDAEALHVVEKMPKWIPGKNKGLPVTVRYSLPITFKLQ